MIHRDEHSFIGQHDIFEPQKGLDFGDCAARTGILAMCGSQVDQLNMTKLIYKQTELRRHPYQIFHNDPKELSRDQLVAWAAGIPDLPYNERKACQAVARWYAHIGHVNNDFLAPDVRLALTRAAGDTPDFWLEKLGTFNLRLSIYWAAYIKPDHELNQIICQLEHFDVKWLKLLVQCHPDWEKNLIDYWGGPDVIKDSGWRDLPEIGVMMIAHVKSRIA